VHGRSQSGETLFVEPEAAVELANRLVELRADESAELARILVEATRAVLAREGELRAAAAALAELELALVSAAFCRRYAARVPKIDPGRTLVLKAARHPLLVEQALEGALGEVVPIDVRLGGEFDLLVITGPNTGGKTLALKAVGVAAWSVRMGWPVCCGEGSAIPLYDGLVVDIGDEQELSQSLSTFASHIVRLRAGLERATPRTLLLLDELGGGTDPDEGAALGDALLGYLLARGVPTLVTTHLGRLKEFCFRHARAENASMAFDARTLRPLYRLLIGTPGESQALAIAERLGLPEELLGAARERLERRDRELHELIAEVRGTREHAEELRARAEEQLVLLARSREQLSAESDALAARGELLAREAQRALEERVAEARRILAGARGLLAQLPGRAARELAEALDRADGALGGAALTERRRAFLDGLKKGSLVFVPRLRQRCVVARIDRAERVLTVHFGKAKLALAFDDVTWCEG
jgi:DNA mismatch repair protein MutS2